MAYVFVIGMIGAATYVGDRIGAPKNRAGWAWGLLLGWLGVVIVACLPSKRR